MVAEGQGHGLGDEGLDDVHADLAGLIGGDVDDDRLGAGPLQVGDDLLERIGAATAVGAATAAGAGRRCREGADPVEGVDGPLPLQEESKTWRMDSSASARAPPTTVRSCPLISWARGPRAWLRRAMRREASSRWILASARCGSMSQVAATTWASSGSTCEVWTA